MSSSPTQQVLSPIDVARHLQSVVGVHPVACAPLSGGTFAVVWRIDLPEPVDGAPLHWDLWDGNVLAEQAEDGHHRLTGIVDGERFLLGDPQMRCLLDELDHLGV